MGWLLVAEKIIYEAKADDVYPYIVEAWNDECENWMELERFDNDVTAINFAKDELRYGHTVRVRQTVR